MIDTGDTILTILFVLLAFGALYIDLSFTNEPKYIYHPVGTNDTCTIGEGYWSGLKLSNCTSGLTYENVGASKEVMK